MENNNVLQKEFIKYSDIVKDDNEQGLKILRTKSSDVTFPLSEDDEILIEHLQNYLYNAAIEEDNKEFKAGVGLASPQIGINKNVFAVDLYDPTTDEEFIEVFINPKILSTSNDLIYLEGGEGCLSVDREIERKVTPRYRFLRVNYINAQGEEKEIKLYNYKAIVFQHEYDHLVGKMYYDGYLTEAEAKQKNINEYRLFRKEETDGKDA